MNSSYVWAGWVFSLAALTVVAGCSPSENAPDPGASELETAAGASDEAAPATITIRAAGPQELQAILDEYRQQNKVVLVDYWANWCVPCKQAFPKTVQLSREHADEGLAVISLAFAGDPDHPDDELQFLQEQNAAFTNLVSALGDEQSAFDAFEVVGLPTYRVYGRDGALVKAFHPDPENPFDESDVEAAVREALAQPSATSGQ